MARVCLAHADVTALAAQIARLVNEDHEDTIEVPAPPFIPAVRLARLCSSILAQAARSCSCLHAMAVLIPSEGSEGSRNSKDACGFGK